MASADVAKAKAKATVINNLIIVSSHNERPDNERLSARRTGMSGLTIRLAPRRVSDGYPQQHPFDEDCSDEDCSDQTAARQLTE